LYDKGKGAKKMSSCLSKEKIGVSILQILSTYGPKNFSEIVEYFENYGLTEGEDRVKEKLRESLEDMDQKHIGKDQFNNWFIMDKIIANKELDLLKIRSCPVEKIYSKTIPVSCCKRVAVNFYGSTKELTPEQLKTVEKTMTEAYLKIINIIGDPAPLIVLRLAKPRNIIEQD